MKTEYEETDPVIESGAIGGEAVIVSSQPPQQLQQSYQQQPQQTHSSLKAHLCPPDSTIWMGDLSPDWDANYIREAFGQYNKDITNVKMVTTDHGLKVIFALKRLI